MIKSQKRLSPFSTTSSTPSTISFKPSPPQKIEIVPITAVIPKTEPKVDTKASKIDFVADDLHILSETIADTLPCLIWPKLPHLDPKLVDNFNHEFYLYCQRKGIDPRNYLFDEMGIAIAAIGIGAVHYENYKKFYPSTKQKTAADKLNADFDHKQDLIKKEEEKIKEIKPT